MQCRDCEHLAEVVLPTLEMLRARIEALEGGRPRPRTATGAKLLDVLHAHGWTQTALAYAIHVHPQTLSRWVRGQHRVPVEYAHRIANVLGLPMEALW